MRLQTPEKIRDLQRKLYLEAKNEPKFRFYLLQDKVWREDVLQRAYRLVRANGGAPGIDGVTFQSIETGAGEAKFVSTLQQELKGEDLPSLAGASGVHCEGRWKQKAVGDTDDPDRVAQMAVKLVIEPIFEADFENCSFGFPPKRDAHQAIEALRQALYRAHPYVLDADLQEYFDTIPHDKLIQVVAGRISDRHILNWIKQWLSAAVVEEDEDGKQQTRKPKRGTPQGAVISPLLANIYLNLFDRKFRSYCRSTGLAAELVRYADDFVILCVGERSGPGKRFKMMEGLGLRLNEAKAKVIDARQGSFEFLGFSFARKVSFKSAKMITLVAIAEKPTALS